MDAGGRPEQSADSTPWADAILAGRWADFSGLPRDLAEDALLQPLGRSPLQMVRHPVMLGHESRLLADTEGFRYWLDHEGFAVLVEVENPPTATPIDRLLDALGDPERESTGRHRRYGALTTEFVYPARGMGITVGESYDDPPTFEAYLVSAQLFVPTDLQGFDDNLGGSDRGGPYHRFG